MGLDLDTGGLIAIKQIHFSREDEDMMNDLKSELEFLRKLHHPNLVRYLGTKIVDSDCLNILTEWYVPMYSSSQLVLTFFSVCSLLLCCSAMNVLFIISILRKLSLAL